jgi:GrpB-like predicted nucleotidyltransferase (UPF0157 family)
LLSLLASLQVAAIEHIGSTAVPGLCAKPVVDVMVGVDSLEASRPAISLLSSAGYQYCEYRADEMHWFCKPSFEFRTHHVHVVPHGSQVWSARLKFRDALRTQPALAAEYAALKRELAARFEFDRDGYTDAKGPFIQRALAASTSP